VREAQSVKKRDEEIYQDEQSPFWAIEKGAVLQEARCFNDTQLSARKCQQVITKLLFLYNQGESFTKTEATEVFFSVTKLFHATDGSLRRLLYLIIKEICPSADEVIIVTSSLMKDMNSNVDLYRSNSIRVLCSITDASLLGQIERFLKQAVVDKCPAVSSAALVSGLRLMKVNPEIVRRWSSEIQEAASSDNALVQFHAISLLYQIRKSDRLAVNKFVLQCIRSNIRSPLATCAIIRYISESMETDDSADSMVFQGFLETCLRNKSETVVLEAAKTIARLEKTEAKLLQSCMTVLQLLLSSPKSIMRFGAIRALNLIAIRDPGAVSYCNTELESLISDPNRAISTAAITTLLRTGSEASIERLMQHILTLFSALQDEHRVTVIDAIRSLCTRYPSKHRAFISFLSTILRDEGGFEYKQAIVDCMIHIIRLSESVKDLGLLHLSEFIEDCEYTHLSIDILHVLGEDGPLTNDPSKYIRYIYNRLFLENAAIRAAAVSALTRFGIHCPALRRQLATLLLRCMHDADDEVRDRATLCRHWLDVDGFVTTKEIASVQVEQALSIYLDSDTVDAFNLKNLTFSSLGEVNIIQHEKVLLDEQKGSTSSYMSALFSIPEFASLGGEVTTSPLIPLTESETEYKVSCIKHVFRSHVVFQFLCTNTIEDQVLENVSVNMEVLGEDDGSLVVEHTHVLPRLLVNVPDFTYVCFKRTQRQVVNSKFACSLQFTAKEIDPVSNEPEDVGYEDAYVLEDVAVLPADFVTATKLSNPIEMLPS